MVYFFSNQENIKIGYTSQKISQRLLQLNTGSDKKLICLGYISGDQEKEKELHKKFSKSRIRQNGEWFYPTDDLINYINEYNEKPNCYIEYEKETNTIYNYFCIHLNS